MGGLPPSPSRSNLKVKNMHNEKKNQIIEDNRTFLSDVFILAFFLICDMSHHQLYGLAQDYTLTCESPDENRNTTEVNIGGLTQSDVYVWGSNSSHQLAEGTQEKIMQPKLATAFESIQQVCMFIQGLLY